jgi:hypothetical protein
MAVIPPARSAVAPELARVSPLGPHRWGQPSPLAGRTIDRGYTQIGASGTTRVRLTDFLVSNGARSSTGID